MRKRVRERLSEGRLAVATGLSVVRRGTGRLCSVCDHPIGRNENEHEVRNGGGDTDAVAHAGCHRIWREESRKLVPPLC
ncbi:MAG TPA: hypothetical protein VFE48_24715 [Methylomirabilota bacterium]|nr:hypothetical protein [Methylomirabilota bacterium]